MQFHIIVRCHFARICSTERVHQITLIYAILGQFIENESRFLTKFLITANQITLKYSLLTSSFIQYCNKDVVIYSGASVSEFICAIRSFISIEFYPLQKAAEIIEKASKTHKERIMVNSCYKFKVICDNRFMRKVCQILSRLAKQEDSLLSCASDFLPTNVFVNLRRTNQFIFTYAYL